jgi:aminoglycoside phosphotransferase (APT) family kinase protein
MHDDEIDTDVDLVRRLLAAQHPQWAQLPIEPVAPAGTDNAMYRLGDDLAVRLPRIHWAVDHVAKERQWLPRLARCLPLAVPVLVATGEPGEGFPHPWSVVQWLPGDLACRDELDDLVTAARDLASFVGALQAIDPAGGPKHNRGFPVRLADAFVRDAIAGVDGEIDVDAFKEAWDRVMAAPDHHLEPVWFHGDLSCLNLLSEHGRLTAVIDWGTCGVGDPAIDSIVAWSLLPPEPRQVYRDALGIDDATWERGKGWVLTGVIGIPYYRDTNPTLVADKVRGIEAILADLA